MLISWNLWQPNKNCFVCLRLIEYKIKYRETDLKPLNMKLRLFIILISGLISFTSNGQTVVMISDGNVQTCNGILYDTGGAGAGGYQNNENFHFRA